MWTLSLSVNERVDKLAKEETTATQPLFSKTYRSYLQTWKRKTNRPLASEIDSNAQ
jgi:hypothetical protein